MHTAPGAYLLHTPGAVCISNMIQEHIWLRIFFLIVNSPGPYGLVQGQLVLNHNGAFRLPSFCIGRRLPTLVFCVASHIVRTNIRKMLLWKTSVGREPTDAQRWSLNAPYVEVKIWKKRLVDCWRLLRGITVHVSFLVTVLCSLHISVVYFYNLICRHVDTHFAKIFSSKCFLGPFSDLFNFPSPGFLITIPE